MEYIENDGQVTREYEVTIDVARMNDIIKELCEKCYRLVIEKVKVAANNEKEAIEKINYLDKSGIKVNSIEKAQSENQDKEGFTACKYIFDCEYLCKQDSYLVHLLQMILTNYQSTLNFKNQNNRLLDLLIQYADNYELKPYDKRLAEINGEIDKYGHNSADLIGISYYEEAKEELVDLKEEIKNNSNYDFGLLAKLYQDAKECISLVLVSETVHYKDLDKSPRIYKLGAKKTI